MAERRPLSLVQKAISEGVDSQFPSGLGSKGYGRLREIPFHFKLDLVDGADTVADDAPNMCFLQERDQLRPQLDAGGIYRLLASGSTTGPAQGGFNITTDIELEVRCLGCKQITVQESIRLVPYPPKDLFEFTFDLIVAPECPILEELTLELRYRVVNGSQWETLANKVVALNGTFDPSLDAEVRPGIRLPQTVPPPPHTAILRVVEPESGVLSVTARNYRKRRITDELRELPSVELANFVKGEVSPEDIKGEMAGISRNGLVNLRTWLLDLKEEHQENLDVIIYDPTGHNFPWEMLEIRSERYLGVMARVARWIPANADTGPRELELTEPPTFVGSILAFVDSNNLKDGSPDADALAELPEDVRTLCDDMATFKQQLLSELVGVGMVYLGCHGMFTYLDKRRNYAGKYKNPSGYVSALNLNGLRPARETRPLVFINACHSGRLMREGSRLFGLPEVLLALDADGYIGTLGPVGNDFASDVLERLAEALEIDGRDTEPAEFLRRLRQQALEALRRNGSEENWLAFIYAFMYIYYGHPRARLRLAKSQEEKVSA